MGKHTVEYPEWAEKYRGKGRTIRKVRNGYGLYKCTSKLEPGKPYPKSIQTYLGMITEKDGFIPKKSDRSAVYLEYGLSHMIWLNFKRDTIRSMYGGHEDEARLAVIQYIFGSVDEPYLKASYLTYAKADDLAGISAKINMRKIVNAAKKLEENIRTRIPDESEYRLVTKMLFLCVVEAGPDSRRKPEIPDSVREVLEKHGLKYI